MKRKIGVRAGLWMGLLFTACCMTGCSSETPEGEETGTFSIQQKDEYDLAAGQWKEAEKTQDSEEIWTLMEYKEDFGQKSPNPAMVRTRDNTAADGSDYYILEHYLNWGEAGSGVQKYYLTHVDMLTLESVRKELILEGNNGEDGNQELLSQLAEDMDEAWADIVAMDAQEGRVCLLVRQMDREGSGPLHYYAVRLNGQQRVESMTDLLPGMEKAGMCRDDMVPDKILCDREGRFYVGMGEYGIFDSSGEFLKMVETPGGTENMVSYTCRLPDGKPVFETSEAGQSVFFCLEGLEEQILYQGKCAYAPVRYMNTKGEIFYVEGGGLQRWDVAAGQCERIYRDSSLKPMACQAILQVSEDTLVMAFYENDENFLFRLQLNGEVEEKVVTIFQLSDNYIMTQYADEYSRKHPGVKINLVTVKEQEDDMSMGLNRLMARITEGEKPDLFLMQREELEILQDNGLLVDLQEMLPEELLDQIFPGALRSGTIENKLYGLPYEVYIDTLVVSEKIWPGEIWSFRDVMALAEKEEESGGFEGILGGETSDELLYDLILRDITAGNSSLIDAEKKECHFDSEEFIRILEFCKKYGQASDSTSMTFEEIVKAMGEGKILAYRVQGDLQRLSAILEALGEGFHCVGFPTEGSYGGYVSCFDHIAMNADGENREEAVDFIQYLLGERVQRYNGVRTARRDILTENVQDGTKNVNGIGKYEYPVFWNSDRSIVALGGKSDGSSFLPEYLEILEKAEPMSSWIDQLGMMVIEEAQAYFMGDKPAEEAARVIQGRVWVYLNE